MAATAGLMSSAAAQNTDEVVISTSLIEQAAQEAPYAITVIDRRTLREAGPMVNASEALQRVPGLVANNRSNYAQDLQISIRGFGARAGFGLRGLRVYTDGIPATGPDGQGQVSQFDLAGAQRIEVLRGPFSALYGNSSGGVITLVSAPVTRTELQADVDVGSFGFRQGRVSAQSPLGGGWDLRGSFSAMSSDGFRPQSAAEKRQGSLRLGWRGARDELTVLLGTLEQPADDPLGLSRAQFELGPRETAAVAQQYKTRKTLSQTQLGASWRHRFDEGAWREVRATAYVGQRGVTQYLAIAPAVQTPAAHGGGVIDFDRDYGGIDVRSRWAFGAFDLVAGAALDNQTDDRQGYENFITSGGQTELGVQGRLRRDELNRARSRDVYVQGQWALATDWSASAGVRHGRLKLSADDRYLANGNDSGQLDFDYTNPVLGLRWTVQPGLNLHASVARGYESPTLGELAYRGDGSGGGFNTNLRAQRSRQFELGAKWYAQTHSVEATLFAVHTNDEIAVATNAGGRQSFQNVGRTQRVGAELAWNWQPAPAWQLRLAANHLDATYRDSFLACAGTPCLAPTLPVAAGMRIAGAPSRSAFAELSWRNENWGDVGAEWRAVGRVPVNDRNTEFAPGYATVALRWSKGMALGSGLRGEWLLRLDNLLDKRYAGSVIVNDANGRFYEPGAPRSVLLGLRLISTP